MLADDSAAAVGGSLDTALHLPGTFLQSVVQFIADELPRWRDDPRRRSATKETTLTAQLCGVLNGAARRAGMDELVFQAELPDAVRGARTIDLVPAPRGRTMWIGTREYTCYDPLFPIECKRLPTPDVPKRERREYLHTRKKTTGGVQRFMAGDHGSDHDVGAIIGYVQTRNVGEWLTTLNHWAAALARMTIGRWTISDALTLEMHDLRERRILATSLHPRAGSGPIALWHLLIEM
ncbi:MAG: hypothetical protein OSB00_13325 [Sphingomonas bacterium]|nr:hypothetical protein [Sphingomonas bacterium]